MWNFAICWLALGLTAMGQAADATSDTLIFSMDHAGTVLVSYTLTVHQDGSAIYAASYPPDRPKYSPYAAPAGDVPPTEISTKVTLSPETTNMLFNRVRATNGFANGCESNAKNIAKTGVKTLTYTSSNPVASCTWNYTEDKNVSAVAKGLEGIALTLDEGRKLKQKHLYDRLALDPEVQYLLESVKQGTAAELGTIAPVLRSIAEDSQVLERVRAKAVKLLAQAAQSGGAH